jgi:hypothetical protein
MSDIEDNEPIQVEEVKEEVCNTITDALKSVIKKAKANNGKHLSEMS